MRRILLLVASLVLTLPACATGRPAEDRDAFVPPRDAGPGDARPAMDARPTDAAMPDDGSMPDDAPASDAAPCPAGQTRCGDVCVSLGTSLQHCGACGNDCTMLEGVDPSRVRCFSSSCQLGGACSSGYGDCNAMATDGCESSLSTAEHCGNCVTSCSGATPVCTRGMTGTYACASGCGGTTPDLCGSLCTDVRGDPMHCGGCDRPCPDTVANGHPTCTASTCGVACDTGYHDCGGACVPNDDPMSCGTSCMPCPVPMLGTATCSAGRCGVSCAPGATACGGDCVDVLTSDAHCGGCDRPCSGACVMGVCDTGVRLSLVSGGDQTASVDQQLPMPIVVRVLDAAMMPIAGTMVTFTAPPGAVITPATATTDAMGRATGIARLGRAIGSYAFTATSPMALTPVTITATAAAPATGTLFPIVNVAHTTGVTGTPGPATVAQMGAARGLAIAPDGTVYVSDYTYHVVRAISPEGVASIVAGRASMAGVTGDLGPATMALLRNPSGLALDPAMRILYIADTGNQRVRAVDLAGGTISTVAGGGTGTTAPWGDGGAAISATLASPGHVRLGPDGALYVSDVGHNRIRRVDRTTGIITLWQDGGTTTCTGATLALYGCQSEQRSCDVVWDAGGRAFVSGYWCGSAIGTTTYAVVRRDTDGTLTRVAGMAAGSTVDGAAASASLLNGAGSLALDPAGNLYVSETTGQRVRRIDGSNGTIATIVGTGTAGYGSDHVAALGQAINTPWDLAFDAQRTLYLSEAGNFVVRAIWGAGSMTAATAMLALYSGSPQTIEVGRQAAMPFAVRLTDGGGSPLAGLPIAFLPIDEGGALTGSSALTTSMGVGAVSGRAGLLPGTYRFRASFSDLHGAPATGSPVELRIDATAPAAGTIFTAVNVARTAGATPGPSTLARVGGIGGLAAAADGTLYIADRTQHVVWRLTPQGALSVLAGTPATAGATGDGGPALMARLNAPHGLALDAPRNLLYVADRTNNKVRVIDLATGIINTAAGGGLTTLPAPYGDGASATAAYLASPGNVAVDAMGNLYVSDTGHNRIRRVDPVLGLIDAWAGGGACTSGAVVLTSCASQPASCHVIFESDGSATISGQVCGTAVPNGTSATYGIVRRATDGTLTHVAGNRLGMATDGLAATGTLIGGAGWLARAPDGALHYVDFGATAHRIRRIDPTAGTVSTIAGTGTAGFMGEYVSSIGAQLSTPWGIVFSGGHLWIADSGNSALRVIW